MKLVLALALFAFAVFTAEALPDPTTNATIEERNIFENCYGIEGKCPKGKCCYDGSWFGQYCTSCSSGDIDGCISDIKNCEWKHIQSKTM